LAPKSLAVIFITAITWAGILYGPRLLPEGKRRRNLETAIHPMFTEDLEGRTLSFDLGLPMPISRWPLLVVGPVDPSAGLMPRSQRLRCPAEPPLPRPTSRTFLASV
jgi:hypothetical protein